MSTLKPDDVDNPIKDCDMKQPPASGGQTHRQLNPDDSDVMERNIINTPALGRRSLCKAKGKVNYDKNDGNHRVVRSCENGSTPPERNDDNTKLINCGGKMEVDGPDDCALNDDQINVDLVI